MAAQNMMAISLTSYQNACTNFDQHYFLAGCSSQFGGKNIDIPWTDLETAVNNYISANQITANDVALRFVYCFDTSDLYLRMEICTLVPQNNTATFFTLNTNNSVWYEIKQGSFSSTNDTSLSDSTYLSDFYYCNTGSCSNNCLENLATDTAQTKYARYVVLPWGLEIREMYTQNNGNSQFTIRFSASAYFNPSGPVNYDHTITVCLLDGNNNLLLDDTIYNNAPFEMKGADMGTLCPACCNVYSLPC